MLEKTIETHMMFDRYRALLTNRQQRVLEMRLFEDWSLAEIAEELSISKQAVHDLVHRTFGQLEEYEAKLGLQKALQRRRLAVEEVLRRLDGCPLDAETRLLIESLGIDD